MWIRGTIIELDKCLNDNSSDNYLFLIWNEYLIDIVWLKMNKIELLDTK